MEEFCERLTRQLNELIEEVEALRRRVSTMSGSTITPKLVVQSRALAGAAAALSLTASKLRFHDLQDRASPHTLAEAERRHPQALPTRGAVRVSSEKETKQADSVQQVRRDTPRTLRDGGNLHPMLARVLDDIERGSRPSPPTLAVISWQAQLSGFKNPQEALLALRKLPSFRRAALLNLEIGEIWGAKTQYAEIQRFLRSLEIRQGRGRGFRRVGRIGRPEQEAGGVAKVRTIGSPTTWKVWLKEIRAHDSTP